MQRPKLSHLAATKRILRYLKRTLDYGKYYVLPQMKEGNAYLWDILIQVGVVMPRIENLQLVMCSC